MAISKQANNLKPKVTFVFGSHSLDANRGAPVSISSNSRLACVGLLARATFHKTAAADPNHIITNVRIAKKTTNRTR